jgi:hypothetical protein
MGDPGGSSQGWMLLNEISGAHVIRSHPAPYGSVYVIPLVN